MFKEVKPDFNFPDSEKNIIEFWKEENIFEKSVSGENSKGTFLFYEGPPTANGNPHPGHVLTRVIKDLFPRFKTMQGYHVRRKAGWDTHGLPVEIEVEKQLGLESKEDIEKYGIQEFIEKCRDSVFTNLEEWNRLTERIGFWIDLDDPYVTFHTPYVESVWWALHEIWKKGLLYKGFKIIPYCPRCGTALSSHEVGQGYQTVKDPSIYVKFKVKGEENTFFLAWTTTPWTLISNAALVVNRDFDYAVVEYEGQKLIFAEKLLGKVFGDNEYTVLETVKGEALLGKEYEPLYSFEKPEKKAHFVIHADFVSLEDGTGIVHSAPAFGEDDYISGLENNLPVIQLVEPNGTFRECVEPWKGVFVKDADPRIISELDSRGLMFKEEKYEHEYPFCWRCDSPLIYYARASWFIKTPEIKEQLLANNDSVGWYPDNIRTGRFGDFLRNNIDWALSRERYWGTPLNIWECSECGEYDSIASLAMLRERNPEVPEDLDLHRPYIDEWTIPCAKCGADMKRVPEVIDCWFDSGSMPFAQWGYPNTGKEIFDESFPCDFISEAIDQTRGWFYSLLAISTLLFGKSPYKNCLVLGHVCDKKGRKMSKSKGNYTDPWDVLDHQGADAMRWYFYSSNHPWVNVRFFEEAITESQKDFLMTLKNVYSFFIIYANIDGFEPGKAGSRDRLSAHPDYVDPGERNLIDKWMISLVHDTVRTVEDRLEHYDIYGACQKLSACVDGLSNWYVRRTRDRFWQSEHNTDKMAAYWTLYESMVTLTGVLAPFIPFLTEEMYHNLVRDQFDDAPESIHLTAFPASDASCIDSELMAEMDIVREIVGTGRAVRARETLKNRQPLKDVTVIVLDDAIREKIRGYVPIIKEELNVKEVIFADKPDEFVTYDIKPNFKILGPKLGPKVKSLGKVFGQMSLDEKAALVDGGTIELDGERVELTPEELDVRMNSREGYAAAGGKGVVVVLNTELTDELVYEGYAREIINRIQNKRKSDDLAYEQRINVFYSGDNLFRKVVETHFDLITSTTLSLSMEYREGEGESTEIDGKTFIFSIEKQ